MVDWITDLWEITWFRVLIYATVTAVATGLGAIPFFFVRRMPDRVIGWAGALASGIMLAASFGLLQEGVDYSKGRVLLGLLAGLLLIWLGQRFLAGDEDIEEKIGQFKESGGLKAILIVGVMTLHSFAEGVGVGVSWASRSFARCSNACARACLFVYRRKKSRARPASKTVLYPKNCFMKDRLRMMSRGVASSVSPGSANR